MNSSEKVVVMGAYVKGIFDSAAARGVLTQSAILTMINALKNLHEGDFTIEPLSGATQNPPMLKEAEKIFNESEELLKNSIRNRQAEQKKAG